LGPDFPADALRLDILTLRRAPRPFDLVADVLRPERRDDADVTRLPNGNALLEYERDSSEEAGDFRLWFWELANSVAGECFRVAFFSDTTRASELREERVRELIDVLRSEIAVAEFASLQPFERSAE